MDNETHISATEARQTFGALIDTAQRSPVIIERQNRPIAALVSMADYERLTKLNLAEFQAFRKQVAQKAKDRGLTQEILEDLLEQDT